jgi:hypothetical protein
VVNEGASGGASTFTEQVAVLPPSTVVTVMVAVPPATAVTVPPLTVATSMSLLDQVMDLFVALAGRTVAVSVSLSPTVSVRDDVFNTTPLTDVSSSAPLIMSIAALALIW